MFSYQNQNDAKSQRPGGGGPAARPVQGRRGHKQFFIFCKPFAPASHNMIQSGHVDLLPPV